MWTVYILRCKDRSFYTGITNDLKRRLTQHRSGNASKFTRSRLPVKLIYAEPAADRAEAGRRERRIKGMTKPEKRKLVRRTL